MDNYRDSLRITVSPFEYNPVEWLKHPRIWLDQYIEHKNLGKCEVYYRDTDDSGRHGYYAILILCDRSFLTSASYMSADIAKTNAIILGLLNIAGYCETAAELQSNLVNLLHSEKGSPKSFATKKVSLAKSLDSYSTELDISQSEIKEKVELTLKEYNLNINNTKESSLLKILKDDYNIVVSKRSIKIACNDIRRDRVALTYK